MADIPSSGRVIRPTVLGRIGGVKNLFDHLRGSGLKASSLRGSVWSAAGFATQKGLQLVSNLILTRILFPEAFGLMALATVFLVGISLFSDLGIQTAIVQSKRGNEQSFLNTAWTIKVIRGISIWLIACLLAWPASKVYEQPILFPLLCVLGITAILNGLASIEIATLNRKLEFKKVVALDVCQSILSTVITIGLAWWLNSVWALAAGAIFGSAIRTLLSHYMLPGHVHRFVLDSSSVSEIVRFGRWILLATMASFIGTQGTTLIQGYLVPIEILGFLAIAMTFVGAVDDLADKLITSVGFSALSRIVRETPERLTDTVRRLRIYSNAITVSAFILLACSANMLIDFLYDPRYLVVSDYMPILALGASIDFLMTLYQSVQLALGDSRGHFFVMTAKAVARTGGMLIGFYVGGLLGMLYGLCIGSLMAYLVSLALAWRAGFACMKADVVTLGIIGIFALNIA